MHLITDLTVFAHIHPQTDCAWFKVTVCMRTCVYASVCEQLYMCLDVLEDASVSSCIHYKENICTCRI